MTQELVCGSATSSSKPTCFAIAAAEHRIRNAEAEDASSRDAKPQAANSAGMKTETAAFACSRTSVQPLAVPHGEDAISRVGNHHAQHPILRNTPTSARCRQIPFRKPLCIVTTMPSIVQTLPVSALRMYLRGLARPVDSGKTGTLTAVSTQPA